MNRKINIIEDLEGKKIVLISDYIFEEISRENWEGAEEFLKEYLKDDNEIIKNVRKFDIDSKMSNVVENELRIAIPVFDNDRDLLWYDVYKVNIVVDNNDSTVQYDVRKNG